MGTRKEHVDVFNANLLMTPLSPSYPSRFVDTIPNIQSELRTNSPKSCKQTDLLTNGRFRRRSRTPRPGHVSSNIGCLQEWWNKNTWLLLCMQRCEKNVALPLWNKTAAQASMRRVKAGPTEHSALPHFWPIRNPQVARARGRSLTVRLVKGRRSTRSG